MTFSAPSPGGLLLAPFSQEAEEAVIGSVLISATVFASLAGFLKAEDFYLTRHRHMWEVFVRLSERNEIMDLTTVSEELRQVGVLEEIGGYAYLIHLINNTPNSMHAEAYGRLVERTATRRKLLQAADKIRDAAMDEGKNIETVMNDAEQAVFEVGQNQVKREFVSMWDAVAQYYNRLEMLMQQTQVNAFGVLTGFSDLDALLGGFQRSDLIVFAGRPGMGKTSFLLSAAMNAAHRGARVGVFTMEMGVEQIVQRLISMETGIEMHKLRLANLDRNEQRLLVEVIGRISELPIYIDDTPAMNPLEMRNKCRRLMMEHGLDLVLIDYMQLMSSGRSNDNNRVQEISYISRHLKELAREMNIPVISAAQLSRAVESRQDKRPLLSDLRESGSIEQDADVVMFLYRDEVYNPATTAPNMAEVIVAKHRNGPVGKVALWFEKRLTKFMDADIQHQSLVDLE